MYKSMQHLRRLGFGGFAAWSFPYMAILAARMGYGTMAHLMLDLYLKYFRSPNTFTMNGDAHNCGLLPIGSSAGEDPRAFTLEAGLMVVAAVAEMLVHKAGGVIFVFPALPPGWDDVSFENLAIEGGHKVSARRKNGCNTYLSVKAGSHEKLKISTDFMDSSDGWKINCMNRGGPSEIPVPLSDRVLKVSVDAGDEICLQSIDL